MERDIDILRELIENQFFKFKDQSSFKVVKDYISAYSFSGQQLIQFVNRP